MSVIAEVKLYAEQLEDGGTYRGQCPECKRKDTFTVTRQGVGFVYNCYSTNCALRGVSGCSFPSDAKLTRVKSKPLEPFRGQLSCLNADQRGFLKEKVGFQDWHLSKSGVRFAPVEDRYAYPIFAPNGVRRGWVLRAYDGDNPRYKSLTRMDKEEPHLSWYGPFDGKISCVVVVEDIPSAVRASLYLGPVVAMCGGGIGPDYVRELREHASRVVWAFDPGAFETGLEHHRRYGLSFESSRVMNLQKDLKNMDEDELSSTLSEV